MKKKILAIVLCICLLATVAVIAVGCNKEKDTNVGEFTYEINNVVDFKGLYSRLGADYDKGVYELKTDLDLNSENWTPIGFDFINAFTGTFKGNGHTIRYSISKSVPDKTDVVNGIADDDYIGLFGCTVNAKFENLNVVADISVPVEADRLYVGALAGYMYGQTVAENISVSGNINTAIADLRVSTVDEYGSVDTEYYGYYMSEYVGGMVGYVKGNAGFDMIDSSVNVVAGKCTKAPNDRVRLDEVAVGGIAGMIRTVDLSSDDSNTSRISVRNLKYGGDMEAIAGSVNMGGIIGIGYRIDAQNLMTAEDNDLYADGRDRLNAGAIAGMVDNSTVQSVCASMKSGSLQIGSVYGNGSKSSFNIGGAIGYLANGSILKEAIVAINIDVARSTNNYTGGLVGMLHFSEVKDSLVTGALTYEGTSISQDGLISYTSEGENTADNYFYIYSGGLIGSIYGESKVSGTYTDVVGYQGLIGKALHGVKVVIVEGLSVNVRADENISDAEIKEALDAWLAASEYADKDDVYCEDVDSTDEKAEAKKIGKHNVKVTYRVAYNYTVKDSWYVDDRASHDGSKYANALGANDAAKVNAAIAAAFNPDNQN